MSLRTKLLISLLAVSITASVALVAVLGKIVVDDKKMYFRDTQLSQLIRLRDLMEEREELARLKGAPRDELLSRETGGDLGDVWIVDRSGNIKAAARKADVGVDIEDRIDGVSAKRVAQAGVSQESFEGHDAAGDRALISYVALASHDAILVSKISMGALRRVLAVFGAYSLVNMLIVLAISIGASVWLARSMTRRLEVLTQTMARVQEGDFSARADVEGNDEIRFVSERLNTLTARLARLVKESVEKARTDEELRTAKIVQDNLLPPSQLVTEGGTVIGAYWPASEVSGDWWSTFTNGGRTFVVIADATGHGVAAALMTSAATAAVSILREREGLSPADLLRGMNSAIYQTSKGGMQMTMFVAAFDPRTGELNFANASHEFPYLISDGKPAQEAVPLSEVTGPRLGESPESTYEQGVVKMTADQTLVLFTDGISELVNSAGLRLSELRLLRMALTAREQSSSFTGFAGNLKLALREYHHPANLADDFTLVLFRASAASS